MIECSLCGRDGAYGGGIFRHCHGRCLCSRCWDGIASTVLAWSEQATGVGGAPTSVGRASERDEQRAQCVDELLTVVTRSSLS